MFITVILVSALVAVVSSDDEVAEGVCLVNGEEHKVGETWQPEGQCALATCAEDGSYTVKGCGMLRVMKNSGYKIVRDASLQYPQCCPKAVRDEEQA